jgi:hypothetical protein
MSKAIITSRASLRQLSDYGQLSPYRRSTTLILPGGTEAIGHEAETKFQK